MENQNASSDILRQEILEQSKTEAEGILEQASKEQDRLVQKAQKEAEEILKKTLKNAEDQAGLIKRKILSSVHLEVKKQQLKTREAIIVQIMKVIQDMLNDFRQSPDYADFLRDSIIEAVTALKTEQIQLMAGPVEKKLLKKEFIKESEKIIQMKKKIKVTLTIMQDTLDDGGIVAVSKDGRMRYDNSFSAQIKRHEHDIRLMIVQDVLS
ncbi:hypothetical protein JW835_08245 [bacterium]|nr:hypothetical protein [bacterium]